MLGTAYIGLGSNIGQRVDFLSLALDQLGRRGAVALAISRLYESAPMYVADQPAFLNAVACLQTDLDPPAFLLTLGEVERQAGRVRERRFGPRTLDLDILLWGERGELVMTSAALSIPHPRLLERAFALLPLADVAPDVVHPLCGRTIRELADAVPGREAVAVVSEGWYALG